MKGLFRVGDELAQRAAEALLQRGDRGRLDFARPHPLGHFLQARPGRIDVGIDDQLQKGGERFDIGCGWMVLGQAWSIASKDCQ